MILSKILENNEKWIKEKLNGDPDFFSKLTKEQNPDVLYIGCSDSRVNAVDFLGLEPGEVFIHRNIANMVNSIDLNVQSVINYSVRILDVNHIIVCGHYNCGGIKSAMQPKDLGILNPWLRGIRDVYRMHNKELKDLPEEERYDRLVELNVYEQCVNVLKLAAVQKSIKENKLKVHGWVFNIHNGKIIDLDINNFKILDEIMEVYRLDV